MLGNAKDLRDTKRLAFTEQIDLHQTKKLADAHHQGE
jgi:hypothetical protein